MGYSRAVRVGQLVVVAGTTAADADGRIAGLDDPYAQAVQIFHKIEAALQDAGAALKDVVRTRAFLVNMDHWQEVGRAHAEFFGDIRPACTTVQVSRLMEPEMLVEIEADAVIEDAAG